jgi:EmrB/QacA subfamily drug resistance transporter
MLLGPVLGPVLGGWLVESLSWRWIFMINVPIGVAAVVLARRVLPPDVPEPHHGLDWRGLALLSPGLAMFIYGLAQSNSVGGLTAPRALVPAGLGLVALALFVGHALRVEEPLIDLRLFADRTFSASAATMLLMVISVFGGMLLLPLYLQTVRGESPMSTGLLLAPQGLGAMLAMPIASRLSDTTGVGRIVPAGLTMIAAAFLGLTQLTATTSYWVFGGVVFLLGAGMGATTMPIFSGALRTLRREGIAQASTTLNIVQQTAAACGAALLSVLLVQAIAAGAPPTGGVPPAAAAAQLPRVAETALATALGGSSVPPYEPSAPQLASAFATTFWWALAMVLIATAVAVALLPKGPPQSRDDGEPREGG